MRCLHRDGRTMKAILKSFIAAAVAAVLSIGTLGTYVSAESKTETEQQTFTLSFNYSGEGVECKDEELFQPIELKGGDSQLIPEEYLLSKTAYFSGWTYDKVYVYEPGDNFVMPHSDTTLEPVWVDRNDEEIHTVSYNVILDGEDLADKLPKPRECVKGQVVNISMLAFDRDGYTQIGWTDGTNKFTSSNKMIMPDHDVVLEPNWLKYFRVFYVAGDVDRINGVGAYAFDRFESNEFDLADSTRLSRSGFNLTGWFCSYDNQIYDVGDYYVMPASDVTFTAVWTPKTYPVVFKSNNKKNQSIKIPGETDTAIKVPECTFTYSGYIFAGWKFEDTIYQPGEDFIIPGALPGLGISLNAVWEKEPEAQSSLTLAEARIKYQNGEISAEELQKLADFLIGR